MRRAHLTVAASILLHMTVDEALDVTSIYSVAGLLAAAILYQVYLTP